MNLQEQQAKAWSLAPDDAKWIAQDKEGDWYGYTDEPVLIYSLLEWQGKQYSRDFFICAEEVNDWNWQDTLQSREGFEVMTSETEQQFQNELNALAERMDDEVLADKQWMPEIGDACVAEKSSGLWVEAELLRKPDASDDFQGYAFRELSRPFALFYAFNFKQPQTEADKKRDEQIDVIAHAFADVQIGSDTFRNLMVEIYDKGVRVIAPDEYVVKRLDTEQKNYLWKNHGIAFATAEHIERLLGITP